MARWKTTDCYGCGGHGVVSVYSASDFEGAGDCRACGGSGQLLISERDRIADYPGGPFRGSWPGKFASLPDTAEVQMKETSSDGAL